MKEINKLSSGERFAIHFPWATLMILVTIESALTGFALPPLGLHFEDKIVHFIIFGLIGWLLVRAFTMESIDWIHQHRIGWAFLLGFLFALSDEFHQAHVRGRDASWGDLLADILGITFFIYYYTKKFKNGYPEIRISESRT